MSRDELIAVVVVVLAILGASLVAGQHQRDFKIAEVQHKACACVCPQGESK
jgi:hypothetical protein